MKTPKLGPTGTFPHGKVRADDQGGLMIAVTAHEGVVYIDFGVEVKWVGMDASTARGVAASLVEFANKVESNPSEPAKPLKVPLGDKKSS